MWVRVFLFLVGIGWAGYGFYCLLSPEALSAIAGISATTAWGTTELRAMYGGLQVAVGLSALLGSFRVVSLDRALFVQVVALGGLGTARLIGAVATGDWSTYTVGGLIFEWLTLGLSVVAMRSQPRVL
jgi:hypothetical protein